MQLSALKLARSTPTEVTSLVVSRWSARRRAALGVQSAFVLDGEVVSDTELGDPKVLLPVFGWHADGIYRSVMGQAGMSLRFVEEPDTLLPYAVNFDRFGRSISELLLFITEALEDAHKNLPQVRPGSTELRALVDRCVVSLQASSSAKASVVNTLQG